MFNPSELDSFHGQGYLRLSGVHSTARLNTLKQKILRELSRLGIRNGGKNAGGSLQSLTPFQQIVRLSSMEKVDVHDVLGTPEIHSAISGLTGTIPVADQGSQLLLSLAHQGRWSLDSLNWHVDIASRPEAPDMRLLHTPSINASRNIRMMATTRFRLRSQGEA